MIHYDRLYLSKVSNQIGSIFSSPPCLLLLGNTFKSNEMLVSFSKQPQKTSTRFSIDKIQFLLPLERKGFEKVLHSDGHVFSTKIKTSFGITGDKGNKLAFLAVER